MFWGLIMEANKRYTQTVAKSFHMSMACLDISQTGSDDNVQVMCSTEGTTYLICNLNRKTMPQIPLDLNFQQGSKIEFVCNGKSSVHLTGYVMEDMDDFDDEEADDEEVDDEESQDEQEIEPEILKALSAKRKINQEKSKAAKKAKIEEELDHTHEDESDDESDDDIMGETLDSDDDEDDEDVEDEEEDDESEEEQVQVVSKKQKQQKKQVVEQKKPAKQEKPKMNGSVEVQDKKNKKQKNQQNAQEQQQQPKKKAEQNQKQEKKGEQNNQVAKKVVEGGVQIEDIKVGNGAPAKSGKMVSVYYIGKLQKNGKKFDATQQGEGFKFRLGKGEVIKGWDVGISGMKVGGKRKITIPAHMGYGNRGSPPQIPANSTLVFDVELKNVH